MRLLIVEDEPRLVEVLRSGLGKAGFVVDAVELPPNFLDTDLSDGRQMW